MKLFMFPVLYVRTTCADGVVRVFMLDNASSKSFKVHEFQEPLDIYAYQLNVNHVPCA